MQIPQISSASTYFIEDNFIHMFKFKSDQATYDYTLSCGTPVTVVTKENDWSEISFKGQKGFVPTTSLVMTAPECFQEKYPLFYDALKVDNADLFYWGKLDVIK